MTAAPWRLATYESLRSTSDLCRQLAEAGEPDGLAILARRQTHGRGSRGREWQAGEGNLFLSVLLRATIPAREAPLWALLAAVVMAEAVQPYVPEPARLRVKWPNDVLLDGAKLAGVLVESAARGDGGLEWMIIGFGANIATAPNVAGRQVACLARVGTTPDATDVAGRVLSRLHHWRQVRLLEGFAPIRAAWLSLGPNPGSVVRFRMGAESLAGAFAGLSDDGALLLQSGGRVRAFSTGEVLSDAAEA